MSHSVGYWYNRRTKHYFEVQDHVNDVLFKPSRFGLDSRDIGEQIGKIIDEEAKFHPYQGFYENQEVRAIVIRFVAKHGFIRIRDTSETLGWQFYGNPLDAFRLLQHYMKRKMVGIVREITFSDLDLGVSVTNLGLEFNHHSVIYGLINEWEEKYAH